MVRNVTMLVLIVALCVIAMIIGSHRSNPAHSVVSDTPGIPHISSVQVLNGSGRIGAANQVADYLRGKGFDVKNIGNAANWNYPFTVVAARTADISGAQQIALSLHTDKIVLLRDSLSTFAVDVYVGADYQERTK